jgi:hypothetical protein
MRPASAQVLARRLTAIGSGDSWSSRAAEQWWELHRAFLGLEHKSVDAADEPARPATDVYPKCFPRLDHEITRKEFA